MHPGAGGNEASSLAPKNNDGLMDGDGAQKNQALM
jgi:hypothetical protein